MHYVNISADLFSILSPKYYGSINYIFIQKLEIYSTVQNIHTQNKTSLNGLQSRSFPRDYKERLERKTREKERETSKIQEMDLWQMA